MATASAIASQSTQVENKTTYSEMLKKKDICQFIGMKEDDPFEIVSENGDLTMVHYRQDADPESYGKLRGVVLDTKFGNVVSYSLPHTPRFVANRLEDLPFDLSKLSFKIGYEGTLLTVFKHGGRVYTATRKRLDFSRSRWGNSKTFGDIYNEIGVNETLFDVDKNYSPYCYHFILVHPDLMIASKDSVFSGFLVYLGAKKLYNETNCKYPLNEVDFELHEPTISEKIRVSNSISLEEANKHLVFGFYDEFDGYQYLDPRLLPGEFLILENRETGEMYRVESCAYAWRCEMRNNNPNLFHRFFELVDYTQRNISEEDYRKMFPVLTTYDQEVLKKMIMNTPIVLWPQNTEFDTCFPVDKGDKLYNIWQAFLVSVPLARQKEVVEFYTKLMEKREEIVEWLNELSRRESWLGFSKRAQDILSKTKSFANDSFNKRRNFDPKTRTYKNIEMMIQENIRNFVSKERGSSLYRLMKEMDEFKNPKTEVVNDEGEVQN